MENQTLKAGDILSASWGYEQTNVHFYYVVKATAKTATIRRMVAKSRSDGPETLTGTKVPCFRINSGSIEPVFVDGEKPLRRKIKDYHGDAYINPNPYIFAEVWNKKPQKFTSYS